MNTRKINIRIRCKGIYGVAKKIRKEKTTTKKWFNSEKIKCVDLRLFQSNCGSRESMPACVPVSNGVGDINANQKPPTPTTKSSESKLSKIVSSFVSYLLNVILVIFFNHTHTQYKSSKYLQNVIVKMYFIPHNIQYNL